MKTAFAQFEKRADAKRQARGTSQNNLRVTFAHLLGAARACLFAPPARSGVSLMEVLVSILIMSIGIVALTTLFPISAMRTLHATQYTHAAIVRYNAEALIDALSTQPGATTSTGFLASAMGTTVTGGVTVPLVPAGSNAFIDPVGYYHPDLGNYDPKNPPANPLRFGNNANNTLAAQLPYRFNGGVAGTTQFLTAGVYGAFENAQTLCALGDTWTILHEEIGVGVGTNTQLNVNEVNFQKLSSAGITSLPTAPFASRVVLFNPEGTASYAVTASNVGLGGNVNSVQLAAGVPANWQSGLGRVMLETQVEKYSWLVTARRDALGLFDCDIVVFYKRGYSTADEQTYAGMGFGTANTVLPFRENSDVVAVEYVTPTATNGVLNPYFRRGGWVLDVENARWYRILDLSVDSTVNSKPFDKLQADLGLTSTPVASSSSNTLAVMIINRKSAFNGQQAMFPRGVVDVYPIGVKTP